MSKQTDHSPKDLTRIDYSHQPSVAQQHASVAREQRDPVIENNPLSLKIHFLFAFILLFAGWYVAKNAGTFSYDQFIVTGQTADLPEDLADVEAEEVPIGEELMSIGRSRYSTCAACHGPNGEGAAAFPPLAGTEWVTGSTENLAMIILAGIHGPIEVAGQTYDAVMPSQAAGLGPVELAGIMSYIRRSFGNEADFVSPEMAEQALDLYQQRQQERPGLITVAELEEYYGGMLEGPEIDPETLEYINGNDNNNDEDEDVDNSNDNNDEDEENETDTAFIHPSFQHP